MKETIIKKIPQVAIKNFMRIPLFFQVQNKCLKFPDFPYFSRKYTEKKNC